LEVTLKKIQKEMGPLLDFDVQTTLESFQNQGKGDEKTRRLKKPLIDREVIPCLIGL
jgi:hypothetical protein